VRVDACLRLPSPNENLERLGERASFKWGGAEVKDGTSGLFEIGLGK
jgi:hypothetical protein